MRLELARHLVDPLVELGLREDVGSADITTEACIDEAAEACAVAVARSEIVACGADVAERVFARVDAALVFERHVEDGVIAAKGAALWSVRGRARSILAGERLALNFVQRMAGIATMTRRYVAARSEGSRTRITDTRKTTPGLRVLERYAVRVGGGHNHRDALSSAVLIKDNHVAACGGVARAIERAKERAPHTSRIECEVDTLAQLDEALAAGADVVLLDNMSTSDVAEAVRRAAGRAVLEASGGITIERVRELSELGVDAISVGALTHSVVAADIGLDFLA